MKRILVTGATGFVGRQVVSPLVDAGWEMHGLRAASAPGSSRGVEWHSCDLLDPSHVDVLVRAIRPHTLLHFAWYAKPGAFWAAPENLQWVAATLTLAESFAGAGGKRLLTAGTCAEYDWSAEPCSEETTACKPATLYGVSKLSMYERLRAYSATRGLSYAHGRIFFTFGPGESPSRFVPAVICALLRGEPAATSHGRQVRDFLSTPDLGAAVAALAASDAQGAVNMASGQGVSLRSVAETIGRLTERPDLLRIGALDSPATEPPILVADTRKLNDVVGWRPRATLEERLRETIAWWRNNL